MPDTPHLLGFIAAGLLLNLTPGPDLMFVIGNALQRGVRAGLVAALGITAGCCVHIALAAFGVSALMAASASAFLLLKWAGAAYLVWIGVQMLLAPRMPNTPVLIAENEVCTSAPGRFDSEIELWTVLRRGFWTNALNPKVALFFPAFVPQTAHPSLVFLALGLLFNFNALWVNAGWALLASWMARRLGAVRRSLRWLERSAGAVLIGFGCQLALSDGPSAAPT